MNHTFAQASDNPTLLVTDMFIAAILSGVAMAFAARPRAAPGRVTPSSPATGCPHARAGLREPQRQLRRRAGVAPL